MGNRDWEMPIHNKCGLPAELCTCPDAEVEFVKRDKVCALWIKIAYMFFAFVTVVFIVITQMNTIEDKIFSGDTYEYNGKTYRIVEER